MKKKTLYAAATCLLSAPALAAPFAGGSASAGKAIHDKQCVACHAARFGGDGSKIYTRTERRIKDAGQLAQQITTCNANLGNTLFPEDERNIGAYLNQQFYRFK